MSGQQFELFHIANPCIGVCQSNRKGYCIGCLRSREERFNWHLKTEQEQRTIIQLLGKRKTRLQQQALNSKEVSAADPAEANQPSLFASPDNNPNKKTGNT